MRMRLLLILLMSCAVDQASVQQAATCQDCEPEPGGEPMPQVQLLSTPEPWSVPDTDDVASGEGAVWVSDAELELHLAQSVGALGWGFAQDTAAPGTAPHPSCSNSSSWLGCSIRRSYSSNGFAWTCWIKTMFGTAYCDGLGGLEIAPGTGGRSRIRYIFGRCGRGVLSC